MGYGSLPYPYFNFNQHQTQQSLNIGFNVMAHLGGAPHVETTASMLDGLFTWVSNSDETNS